MNYFKYKNVVVKSETAPVIMGENSKALSSGNSILLSDLGKALSIGEDVSLVIDDFKRWKVATELEYSIYRAVTLNLIDNADRDVQAALWALNHGTIEQLRSGGLYPGDGKSIGSIVTVSRKVQILKKTQHWYADRPDPSDHRNGVWSRWIVKIRDKGRNPFIYLG